MGILRLVFTPGQLGFKHFCVESWLDVLPCPPHRRTSSPLWLCLLALRPLFPRRPGLCLKCPLPRPWNLAAHGCPRLEIFSHPHSAVSLTPVKAVCGSGQPLCPPYVPFSLQRPVACVSGHLLLGGGVLGLQGSSFQWLTSSLLLLFRTPQRAKCTPGLTGSARGSVLWRWRSPSATPPPLQPGGPRCCWQPLIAHSVRLPVFKARTQREERLQLLSCEATSLGIVFPGNHTGPS